MSADLGYCALDRRRRPLTGRELRGCWEAATAIADPASGAGAPAPNPAPAVAMTRDFIPIEELTRAEPGPIEIAAAVLFLAHEAGEPWAAQTSLFGDVER